MKKKDGKVVTTRKVFSKTKLNLDAVKKPLSKLTSAPIAMAQDTHEVEQLSQKPEREFQHGKTSQLPEHTSGNGNNGIYQISSCISFRDAAKCRGMVELTIHCT